MKSAPSSKDQSVTLRGTWDIMTYARVSRNAAQRPPRRLAKMTSLSQARISVFRKTLNTWFQVLHGGSVTTPGSQFARILFINTFTAGGVGCPHSGCMSYPTLQLTLPNPATPPCSPDPVFPSDSSRVSISGEPYLQLNSAGFLKL
ncbi:unnamed protein product [Lota lota]